MMSWMRQELPDEPLARSYAVTHPTGTVVPPQPAGWDLVVHADGGVLAVVADDVRLTVPSRRAAVVPMGTATSMEVTGRTSLRNLYLRRPFDLGAVRPRVLDLSPLARELLLEAVRRAPVWPDTPAARLVAVLVDELASASEVPASLPLPRHPSAAAVAAEVLADPADGRTVAELAAGAGIGRRTLERRFREDTAMSVGQWRTRARLVDAVRRLADGQTTTEVARAVGFATPSAFSAAFRRELGTPPSRMVRDLGRRDAGG
jgi:AraC-like DNA-binding protein